MRSNDPSALGSLGLGDEPAADKFEAAFSIVLPGEDERGPRRLPSLYMGKTLLFAGRQVDELAERFRWIAHSIQRSTHVPTYTLHAVRLGERRGLYARDFFNRSPFRRSLMKLGIEFAHHPFVTFTGQAFHVDSWGSLLPEFVVMPNPDPREAGPVEMTRAELAFAMATYRIGGPGPTEIQSLISHAGGMRGLSGEDPVAIVGAIDEGRAQGG